MRFASIDIGSNTALLLIVERSADGRLVPVHEDVEICRLAEGLDASGRIGDGPLQRTALVLERFAAHCRTMEVDRIWATGTAPFRRAGNAGAAAGQLGHALGAPVDVVSGELEAQLGRLATRAAFPNLARFVLIDIGGASTELVVEPEGEVSPVSIDLGSVRLTERFAPEGILRSTHISQMRAAISAALDAELVSPGRERGGTPPLPPEAIAIAGTATTLAAMDLGLRTWDATRVHGHALRRQSVEALLDRIALMAPAERARRYGLDLRRADVIASGAVLLHTLMLRFGWESVRTSDRGLRWGRLHAELQEKDQ